MQKRILLGVVLGLIIISLSTSEAFAAGYLKIGDIKGESSGDKTHDGWIEIQSFSFGASSSAGAVAGERSAGKSSFSDFSITKEIDKSSPKLFELVASGERIQDVTFELTTSGGTEKPVPYMTITLKDAIVSSYSVGGSEGTTPTESVSLNYGAIKFNYVQLDDRGGIGEKVEASWNVVTNEPRY